MREGLHPEPPRDPELRARLETECAAVGAEQMHARLRAADPAAADALAPQDRQRILRALEIVTSSGHTLAWWRERPRRKPLEAEWRAWEVTCDAQTLALRIEQRTREMWQAGLLEETRALVAAGQEEQLRRLAAIGYDEALAVLRGSLTPSAAEAAMSLRTRQLAKRQRTWFRHHPADAQVAAGDADAAWIERAAAGLTVAGATP